MTLNLDVLDIVVIAIGAIIGITALAILRLRVKPSEKKEYKKHNSFLVMGGLWYTAGLVFGPLYRGDSVFDNTLFILGLIFLAAGGIGVITEYLRH